MVRERTPPAAPVQEEVSAHVLQYLLIHGRRITLIPLPALWSGQVRVEISDHQQRGPWGSVSDGRNNVLYC